MATEYISRDAMHKANRYEWDGVCGDYDGHQIFIDNENMIDSIPAADVVEVVRCRDCVHYIAYRQDCGLYALGKSNGLENPQPEDFCSRGERRCEDGV